MLFRVYFNRRGSSPWSVDEGTAATERTAAAVVLSRCSWRTAVLPPESRAAADPDAAPYAWIEVEAKRAELLGGKIVFVP